MRLANEKLLKSKDKKGGIIIDAKNLTQLEIDNIIDKTINLSIILKLLKLDIITEKQYYVLKEKIHVYTFIIERLVEFIMPSVIVFIVVRIMKRKYSK